jgi:hypothetical protein
MYRLEYQIIDNETEEVVNKGSVNISDLITEGGMNESVDEEMGKAMRRLKNTITNKEQIEQSDDYDLGTAHI